MPMHTKGGGFLAALAVFGLDDSTLPLAAPRAGFDRPVEARVVAGTGGPVREVLEPAGPGACQRVADDGRDRGQPPSELADFGLQVKKLRVFELLEQGLNLVGLLL